MHCGATSTPPSSCPPPNEVKPRMQTPPPSTRDTAEARVAPRAAASVRVAVVGCGHIGRRHLRVVSEEPRARLAGYFDIDPEARARAAADFPDARAYANYAEVLADDGVDLVSVCTPHGLHAEQSIAAAEAGKHVLVEKPMALSTADADRMRAAATAAGTRLFVVKQNRFNRPVCLVKDALDAGKLGRVYLAQCNVLWNRNPDYYAQSPWRGSRALEGGMLQTQVSHFLDLLIWWLGDVEACEGLTARLAQDIEFEDCGVAALRFGGGAVGSLTWTSLAYNANLEGSITLLCERGNVKVGGRYLNRIDHWDVLSYPLPIDTPFDDRANDYGTYQGSANNHDRMLDELMSSLLERRAGLVEGEEARRTIAAIDTIYAGTKQDRL